MFSSITHFIDELFIGTIPNPIGIWFGFATNWFKFLESTSTITNYGYMDLLGLNEPI